MAKVQEIKLEKIFSTGLRQNTRASRNSEVFTDLVNARIRPEGLVEYEAIVQPVSNTELSNHSISISFPFPQLFRCRAMTLLLTQTKLFLVDEDDWTLTEVTTYDLATPASTKAIVSGGTWHIADFWNTIVLFNGACSILKFGNDSKFYVQDSLVVTTGCRHRGRIIQGGFTTSSFWSSSWKTLLQSWIIQDNPPNSSIVKTLTDIGPNWVWWSTIGGGDLRLLHDPTFAVQGPLNVGHSSAIPYVRRIFMRNELGGMPMSFQGNVLKVQSLGTHVVVFGVDGIQVLTQTSSPVPTFGTSMEIPFGVAGRSAVAGNDQQCVFLDNDGCLWSLSANLELSRLDYTEFFNPMIGTDIVITQDPHERDFFISNTNKCYSLSRDGGLSQTPQKITSFEWADGGPVGFFTPSVVTSFNAVTEWMDMGYAGLKQIQSVEVGGAPDSSLEVAFYYRFDRNSDAKRTSYKPINREGNGAITISGNEFRLVLRNSGYTGVNLDYVNIKWKPVDGRFLARR